MNDFSTLSADGTQLFGRHWPVENPRSIMALVHGFGEHCGRYAGMAAHLNANGTAVVAIDLRGHGQSAGKRGVIKSYDDFRADLAALLNQARALYPNAPLVLYGHSMGGGVVLDHGSRNLDGVPIIASAPLIVLADPIPGALRAFVKLMGRVWPSGSIAQPIDGTKISNLGEEQTLYIEDPLNHGTLGFRLAEAMVSNGEHIAEQAASWNRPLLLLHSKADQLTRYESSAEFAKTARQVAFHPFETSQHEMHNDAPRSEVYALMTDFILKYSDTKTA